jgi:hypothetical protein
MSVLARLLPALDLHHDIIVVVVQVGSPGWWGYDGHQGSRSKSGSCQA